MKSKWLFVFVMVLMCGTAWGQGFTYVHVMTAAEAAEFDSVNRLTRDQQVEYYHELDRKEAIQAVVDKTTADSLRLIRQVDIALDYLKSQGYELPKVRTFTPMTTKDLPDSVIGFWELPVELQKKYLQLRGYTIDGISTTIPPKSDGGWIRE